MDPTFILHILLLLVVVVVAQPISSHITVIGSVFCDVCYNYSFTKHSYFLPGVDVHVQCKFQDTSSFSVKRRTNRYGLYRLDIPWVDGFECVKQPPTIQTFCKATLIKGSSLITTCNVPVISASSKEITLKSTSTNGHCVYGVSALTYRPSNRNSTLCGDDASSSSSSFNSSKFFLPYFPWPWPSLPPFPQLPPFPSFPPFRQLPPFPSFPPLPPFPPFPFPQLPPLPPLPPLPQLPPLPPLPQLPPLQQPSPPPPPLNPRSWMPNTGPPPQFNPTNWIPVYPFPVPPTTWMPPSPN